MKTSFILLLLFLGSYLQSQTLFDLVVRNDLKAVKEYEGAVNLRDENEATPLMWAAYASDFRMVKKGADTGMKGWILHRDTIHNYEFIYGSNMAIAAGESNIKLLKYLIRKCHTQIDDREVNLYENRENGWTALHWAAVRGNEKVARYLIRKGADIDARAKTDFNQTPLILAINFDQTEMARLLIRKGADCNLGDMYGISVLTYAFESESRELIKLLLENGAEFNSIEKKTVPEQLQEIFGISDPTDL